jgi:hypothetical protein
MIRSAALDEAFLGFVRAFARGEPACDEQTFDQHARETFAYQLATNEPYARFAAARGFGPLSKTPYLRRSIPARPSSSFTAAARRLKKQANTISSERRCTMPRSWRASTDSSSRIVRDSVT